MDTLIRYVNHNGEELAFGGGGVRDLNYLEHQLRDYRWTHTDANGRVARFSRGMVEKTFPVGIAAEDGASGIELRNAVLAVTEADVEAMEPGRFVIGDWSLECYVIGCQPTAYWMDDRFAELNLTVLAEKAEWIREIPYHFEPRSDVGGMSGNGDFPIGFPWEFARPVADTSIENDSLAPCPFLWRAFGPVSNPRIVIGSNQYRVDVGVPSGARLEVDTAAKTIVLIDSNGEAHNAFADRLRGAEGSGSYIFEPVPLGECTVTWTNDYVFDLVLYDIRSAPGWSL